MLSSETSCITGQAHFPESVLFQSQYTFIFLRKGQKMISYCVIVNLEGPLRFCQVSPTSSKQFLILKEGSMVVKAKHCYQHQSNNQILIWISSLLLQAFPPQWQSKKKNTWSPMFLTIFPMCQRQRRQESIQFSPGSISTGFEILFSGKVMNFIFYAKSRANPQIWN